MGFHIPDFSPIQLIQQTEACSIDSKYVDTGFRLTGDSAEGSFVVRIIIASYAYEHPLIYWGELCILAEELPLTCMVSYCFQSLSNGGQVIYLESLLIALEEASSGSIQLEPFAAELASAFDLHNRFYSKELSFKEINVSEAFSSNGFYISNVVSFKSRLIVTISKKIRDSNYTIIVDEIDFRPTSKGQIGVGRWQYSHKLSLSAFFKKQMNDFGFDDANNILTHIGCSKALKYFTWSKLALLSRNKATQQRVEIIKKNLHLEKAPKLLVNLLREAELYAISTSTSQILKSLPKLITAAKLK